MDAVFSALAALGLAGFVPTQVHPVIASNEFSGERLTGTAISTLEGGSFTIVSDAGVICTGLYDVQTVSDAQTIIKTQGGVQCDDGRSGIWATAGSLSGGHGTAELRGEKFDILFGDFATEAEQ